MVIPTVFKNKKVLIGGAAALFVILASLPSIYFYRQYQQAQLQITNPTAAAQEDAAATIIAVGKLMQLPSGETPTVAIVQDITKLRDQTFFSTAKNGDKVLIYTVSRKAIIYRPSTNKIIDVAPVNLGAGTATGSAQQTTTTPVPTPATYTVVLRNGTSATGATQKIEDAMKSKATNLTVSDRDTAAVKTYTKTVIIDVTGDKTSATAQLATSLGITVGTLPKGEKAPNADFLIIVGTDQK